MKRQTLESDVSDNILSELIILEKKKVSGEPVQITNNLREIAEMFNVPFYAVNNRYYGSVRGNYKKEDLVVENIKKTQDINLPVTNDTPTVDESMDCLSKNLNTPDIRPSKPPYRHKDIIEVEVAKVLDRVGAICVTMDDYHYQGLIHISNIKDGYVTDVRDYFADGDIIKCRFLKTNDRGELELSTKGLKLQQKVNPPFNLLADKLEKIKDDIQLSEDEKNIVNQVSSEEEKIMKYINGIVGALSPAAKEQLLDSIRKYGVFSWTLSMADIAQDFQNDLGLLFINKVKSKLEEDGL